MALVRKIIPLNSLTAVGDYPQLYPPVHTPDNTQTMTFYYDDTWPEGQRDIIAYFEGGGGQGTDELNYGRPDYIVNKLGKIYVRFGAYLKKPIWYVSGPYFSIHDLLREANEVEQCLEEFYTNTVNDTTLKKWCKPGTRWLLTGSSRGAGSILNWSKTTRFQHRDTYRDKVIALVSNSPFGGGGADGDMRRYTGPGAGKRALIDNHNFCNHKCIATFGCGDYTHTTRSVVELLKMHVDNPLVDIRVMGDDEQWFPHAWASLSSDPKRDQYEIFFDLADDLIKEYRK